MMGCAGLLVACIGKDPVLGRARFTFGQYVFMGGINMIPSSYRSVFGFSGSGKSEESD